MTTKTLIALLTALCLLTLHEDSLARGRGGGGGGGGGFRGGGGGMARPSGGGMSRPAGGGMSRPSGGGMASRPSGGGMSRPSGGMPGGGGMSRPSGGMNRPGGNMAGGGMNRPGGNMNRPNIGGGSGSRPNIGGGNQIAHNANRPNFGGNGGGFQRPGIGEGNRPNFPGQNGGGFQRPGLGEGNRPNFPNRPGNGGNATKPSFPGQNGGGIRPGNRPDWANNRPNNRPDWNNNRPNWNNNRPNWNNGNNNFNFNNINNNHNNFAVGNGNNWNNGWHHGYWGNGNAAAWGLGYGMGYNHGYWNGYANRPWYRPWYNSAAVWGLGAWALGSVYYDSGYSTYSNPYYASSPGYYDYSQPIQIVTPPAQVTVVNNSDNSDNGGGAAATDAASAPAETPPAPSPEAQASRTHLDAAQDAFRAGKYDDAGRETDLAIEQQPNDAALHEFRALVDFAAGDYNRAAGTLYAVLSAGPGWDWTTMSSQYPKVDVYTAQLRKLEQHVKSNPDDTAAHFVLAYHYITATHSEAAIRQLQEVVQQQPNDQLAAHLIKGLGGEVPAKDGAAPPAADLDSQTAQNENPPPDIDPKAIVGTRTAQRADGSTFTLDLTDDDKFTWSFERDGQKHEFGGTYKVDGAVLVLERDDKATMPGLVTMEGDGFNFKLFGSPDSDPGLDFKG